MKQSDEEFIHAFMQGLLEGDPTARQRLIDNAASTIPDPRYLHRHHEEIPDQRGRKKSGNRPMRERALAKYFADGETASPQIGLIHDTWKDVYARKLDWLRGMGNPRFYAIFNKYQRQLRPYLQVSV